MPESVLNKPNRKNGCIARIAREVEGCPDGGPFLVGSLRRAKCDVRESCIHEVESVRCITLSETVSIATFTVIPARVHFISSDK